MITKTKGKKFDGDIKYLRDEKGHTTTNIDTFTLSKSFTVETVSYTHLTLPTNREV